MKISLHNRRDGFALLIAMTAVILLSLLAARLAYSMKVEMTLARRADSEQQLLWLGRSGVELARYVLSEETSIAGQPYDSLNEIWAGGPGGPGETNSPLLGTDLSNYPIGDGAVSLKIIDLERKVNINRADPQALQQALTLIGVDADDISVISDSIQDWIDADDSPRLAGAESDYYQTLNPPYYAKNAPIDDLSELLLVKGVTPDIYWGTSATNHPLSIFQQKQKELGLGRSPNEIPDYPIGMVDIFTPISSGRININTADTNVLQMIPGVDAATAETIVQQRAGPDGVDGTEDDTPFRSVNQLAATGLNPQIVQQLSRLCTVRSYVFEVHVTAKYKGFSREYIAILFRNSATDIQIVSFYWKDDVTNSN
ncbi:MAG TPA: general secretion pathway protein GspK [Verrucomicrobiae bacterium]|nr:general secretion pathway protein GspK [Verrucomicrobiae bacterium]